MNLSRQTLNGFLKYPWIRDPTDADRDEKVGCVSDGREGVRVCSGGLPEHEPCALARLLDWGDDVTYAVHDMDDFYRAGLVPLDRLKRGGLEVERFAAASRTAAGSRTSTRAMSALQDVLGFFPLEDPYEGRIEERIALRGFGSTPHHGLHGGVDAGELGDGGQDRSCDRGDSRRSGGSAEGVDMGVRRRAAITCCHAARPREGGGISLREVLQRDGRERRRADHPARVPPSGGEGA